MRPKISFCTVSMNRTEHFKQTFLKNVLDNVNYPYVEFIILDYNSTDGLGEYVRDYLQMYIKTGIVKYYHNTEPIFFNMPHAKNMALKLADGDIICLVDADNYIGNGFAAYVANNLIKSQFLTTIYKRKPSTNSDVLGRICLFKSDFHRLKGFDEGFKYYGLEDLDFVQRLEIAGCFRKVIKTNKYLKAISHTAVKRFGNMQLFSTIAAIFVGQQTPFKSALYFFFNTGECYHGLVLDNVATNMTKLKPLRKSQRLISKYILSEEDWSLSHWCEKPTGLSIIEANVETSLSNATLQDCQSFSYCGQYFRRIVNDGIRNDALYLFSVLPNFNRMVNNKNSLVVQANPNTYGSGHVYKNFDYGLHLKV
ncbi:glycosyltransferase family A protein [Pedobacter sp. JY14-1]|uniref:glycosyltransferase family 2 protein n=1 Tax=Pedobacter sp. JY14-1 TaxID=3034151 RepID=UPI0023E0DFA6|nr:glycosyltransferase family A protein [Pedobacter sp. JY14-1]